MASGEGRHEAGGVRVSPKRERCELHTSRPALGSLVQLRHGARGDVGSGDLCQEGGRLLECEAKIGTAQLRQLPTGPKPSQWQRRVGARDQRQPQPRRQPAEEEPDAVEDGRRGDQVEVVENEHDLIARGEGAQIVDHDGHHLIQRRGLQIVQEGCHLLADPRPNAVERRGNVAPEPRRVVLPGIQRQPCCGVAALASEVPEQRRLAEPGWGAYQDEPTTYRLGKAAEQARTRHDAAAGDVELRGQEILALRGASGWVRRDRLSHRASLSQQLGSRPTAQMPESVWATPPTNLGQA